MKYNKHGALIKYCREKLNYNHLYYLRTFRDVYRNYFDPYPYRRYTKRKKAIFIHIPKTAGTSILNSLGGWAGDHCSYREYLQASPTKFENYFKFCFVRNPYERLISTYEYLKQGGNKTSDLILQKRILDKYPTFDSFVRYYLNHDIIYRVNVLKPQYWFIYDEENILQVDYLARFENIDREYEKISTILNLKKKLYVTNSTGRSKKNVFKDYYNEDLIAIVNNMYHLDFELLEYKKHDHL